MTRRFRHVDGAPCPCSHKALPGARRHPATATGKDIDASERRLEGDVCWSEGASPNRYEADVAGPAPGLSEG